MFYQLKNPNFYLVFLLDLLLFSAALFGAYLLRFDFVLTSGHFGQIGRLLPFFLVLKSGMFIIYGLYRGMFRYAGIHDMGSGLQGNGRFKPSDYLWNDRRKPF